MEAVIQLGIILFFLGLGYGVGHYREKKHFHELDMREEELKDIKFSSLRRNQASPDSQCMGLVTGSTVIATDYFKVYASAIRNLFGGEIKSYVTLVERARREAMVRMLAEARDKGANRVLNVRIETSTVGGQQQKKSGGVEVMAYGTAICVAE